MSRPRSTPRAALAFLRRFLDDDAFEAIGGDLQEEFEEIRRECGAVRSQVWLWRQAIRSAWSRRPSWRHQVATQRRTNVRAFVEQRWHDLRFAARQIGRAPCFTAVVVTGLALGIGLTTTTFSIVRGSLLSGLPFERADELVHFERQRPADGQVSLAVTPHDYAAWREAQTTFVDLGAYTDVLVVVGGEEVAAESHLAIRINPIALDLLGVEPAIGRSFGHDDDRPGSAPVILIGDSYWRTRFGADPGVVGRSIRVDGIPTTIIGVMPADFGFPVEEQLWMPLGLDFSRIERGAGRLDAFGRLRPGATIADARREFDVISRNLQEAFPGTNAGINASLQTFEQEYIGDDFANMMLTMMAGALLVLGIACANVANLLTARTTRRTPEIAVRTAVGGGRGHLFAQLMTETTLMAAIGGLGGLGVAWVGLAAFRAAWARGVPLGLPHGLSNGLFWWHFEIDAGVLAFTVGITLMTALIAGVAPATRAVRGSPWSAMQTSRSSSGHMTRTGNALVVVQFALTAGLLVAAGLMVKSVYNTSTADDGLPVDGVLTARVQLLGAAGALPDNYPDIAARQRFWNELAERLAIDARTEAVGLATSVPLTGAGTAEVQVQGREQEPALEPSAVVASPGFFEVFDGQPVDGRLFSDADRAGAEPVALINEAFARIAFESRGAVGRRVRLHDGQSDPAEPWLTVIGVVPDLWVDGERHEPAIYLPLDQALTGPARAMRAD